VQCDGGAVRGANEVSGLAHRGEDRLDVAHVVGEGLGRGMRVTRRVAATGEHPSLELLGQQGSDRGPRVQATG
jgi:hypothetical protein